MNCLSKGEKMQLDKDNKKWMGKLPESWNTRKIKYVLWQRNEDNLPIKSKKILSLTAKQGVIPYEEKVGGGNKPKQNFSAYKLAYPGDIVMNSMNILSGAVGLSKYKGCVSPVYYMLRPISKADDVRFFYYVFANKAFQHSLLGIGNGILIKKSDKGTYNTIRMRIPIEKLKNLVIPYPSAEEQRTIADFLDKKCAEIDRLCAQIQREIDVLEEYRKSIITKAVTKGLNDNVSMKDSGIAWVGKIPKDWKIKPIYTLFKERKNKNDKGKEQNLLSLSYGNVIRKDINKLGGLLPNSFNTYNIVEKNDIIIRPTDLQNDKRSLRTGLVKEHGIITSAYIDLAPLKNTYSAFFHYQLHAYDIEKVFYNMGNGVRQGLNYNEFKKLRLIVPPENLIKVITDYLDKKTSQIDKVVSQKQKQLSILADYKNSLLFEYVTGKKKILSVGED